MNVIAFYFEIPRIDIRVLKSEFYFISPWKKYMVPQQVEKSKHKRRKNIGPEKSPVTHAGIENRNDFSVTR